jgi:hypothetical protein
VRGAEAVVEGEGLVEREPHGVDEEISLSQMSQITSSEGVHSIQEEASSWVSRRRCQWLSARWARALADSSMPQVSWKPRAAASTTFSEAVALAEGRAWTQEGEG